jgi:hypothetical protein
MRLPASLLENGIVKGGTVGEMLAVSTHTHNQTNAERKYQSLCVGLYLCMRLLASLLAIGASEGGTVEEMMAVSIIS